MVNETSTGAERVDQPVVEFGGVGLRYGHGPDILHDVTFSVPPGSFQFLTGPSGSGKTSLIRLILMSLLPTSGLVRIFGTDVSGVPPAAITALRRRMGIVFQDFRLVDHLTVYGNVSLPLQVRGREEETYRAEVLELIEWVGLRARANDRPSVLSGGEKQRAAIARAVIARPELILADEPTGNVDPPLARRLLRLFMELNRLGTSVVIATHDVALLEQVDVRRLVLADGRLHADP